MYLCLFCSWICRKINRCFSCIENFVFIVKPPAGDVCISICIFLVFVVFCSCILRKINIYFSCTDNFVFIVEPHAADVCIRGGRGLYGRAQQYAHWPVIGKKIQTQIQIQIQIRKQIHGWALQYAHRPTMDRQMKEIYSVGSNIEQKLPFWGEVHKRKQIRKQMLWGKHSSTLCKN